jgi:hypothetical protein
MIRILVFRPETFDSGKNLYLRNENPEKKHRNIPVFFWLQENIGFSCFRFSSKKVCQKF